MSDFAQDSDHTAKHSRPKRRRLAPAALIAGVAASAAIALSMTGALGAFTAQITNSANSAATGTLTMQETGLNSAGTSVNCSSTDGGSVSTNTATCSTISKYGYSTTMVPGTAVNTTISIKNTGTVTANTFTLTPQTCSQSNSGLANGTATDLCAKMTVTVSESVTLAGGSAVPVTPAPISTRTLAAFGPTPAVALPFGALPAGATATFVFSVNLPSQGNTMDNTYQGLAASQQMIWNFAS
jgi:hypothetical protein